jgi:hypothetical protein
MSYISEFPDYDGDFYCPDGWEDHSWHNDVCPRARHIVEKEDRYYEFTIWQDYVFADKREYDRGTRFMFQVEVNNEIIYSYETDSLLEIQNLVKGVCV